MQEEFHKLLEKLPYHHQLFLLKEKCKHGDKKACEIYDRELNGDKTAPAGTKEYLGLKGRWHEMRDPEAGKILMFLGEL